MRYRNKRTGTIAEPTAEVAALNFAHNSDWVEVAEEVNAETDSPHEGETPENDEIPKSEKESECEEMTEAEGEEESQCLPSEQTATLTLNMPTDTSENNTEQETPTESDGKPSAKRKGKALSKPPAES